MGKAQILVVEDDRIVARDIQNSLKKLGFDVCASVPSGEEALEEAEKQKPDLILMDVMLKREMNGTEAAELIRSRFNIPVIYLTAYADDEVIERAKKTEPFGYIIKPFEERELNTAIEMAFYKHKVEKKLKESEQWLSTTLRSIGDAVIATDTMGHVTFMNPVAESLTGWQQEEATGKPLQNVFNIINEETREEVENPVAKVLREGMIVGLANHTMLKTKEGTGIPIDDSGSPIRDERGNITGVVLVFRDVRGKREAEQALRESEAKYRRVSDNSPAILYQFMITPDGAFSFPYVSDVVKTIMGVSPEDIMKDPSTLLGMVHPEDQEMFREGIMRSAESLESFPITFRCIKDGEVIWIEARGTPEPLADGGSLWDGFFLDITERKQMEEELLKAKKLESLGVLAGGIAHQFNNALSAITGHTGLLEMAYPQDEKILERVKAMKQSAHRMAHLTSQLLAYARGGKYNPQTMSLSELVEGALPLIQHTLDPDIHLETDLPPDILNVEIDRTQMQMVLSAIVDNSNEAIEPPGRIRISTKNIEVDQGSIKDHPGLKPGPHVCLSIEDDGKGMDKETKERIFEPFFTTNFMGRGLGMASVYGVVMNHDGMVSVDSEPGKGTTVTIYLPALEAKEEVEEERIFPAPAIDLPTGEETVLVIEDEENLVELFREILEMLGYSVLQARTGEEAVEIAKTFDGRIDLALLDIKLPDMSGDQVYPLIMEARPDLKVIVCSGYSIDGPAWEILDAGAEGFIQKPFLISDFAEKLKQVLEGR